MRTYGRNILFWTSSVILMSGCVDEMLAGLDILEGTSRPAPRYVDNNYIVRKITIIEGKTTKQQVLSALGQPTSFNNLPNISENLTYKPSEYRGGYLVIDLTYITKDGTSYRYPIHASSNTNHLSISFHKGVIYDIHVF